MRAVIRVRLVAPNLPAAPRTAREKLKIWPGRTRLDDRIKLVRLAGMLPLPGRDKIHLTTPRRKRSGVLAPHPEYNQLCDVPEIETDAATIGAAIFPDFMPDDVRLVSKAPRRHDGQAFGQECVRNPKI